MKAIKSIAQFEAAQEKIISLRKQIEELENARADFRLKTLRNVKIENHPSKDNTYVLTHNERKLTVVTYPIGCKVYDGKKLVRIVVDGNRHDVRFSMATGQI